MNHHHFKNQISEQERIRAEYKRRANDPRYSELYSQDNVAHRFYEQNLDSAIHGLFAECEPQLPRNARVLDVGCSGGGRLLKLALSHIATERLHGVDLIYERIQHGKGTRTDLALLCADAHDLPYPDQTFDLVTQFTVFTSILDTAFRRQVADEMRRVVKSEGVILWYDFRFNPTNRHTRGIEYGEIQALFPECAYVLRRVTLAPPLTRILAPRSQIAVNLLNRVQWLKTHYLGLIWPHGNVDAKMNGNRARRNVG